jgi:hypothetical protein
MATGNILEILVSRCMFVPKNSEQKILLIIKIMIHSLRSLERGCSSAVGRPRPTALLPPRSYCKPEAATAVDKLLIMGVRMSEKC